ncbi:GNAT family N-acetyltransferase [Piscibacillus halophilus]|uniref:Protein N-acetyltransferase, RimJ/RimL family n=1 Tax=Piscibacillus halophilus TaxID=571933 RepID=A0A1H9M243_9BACI|nr:GNAT family N-acetyltransferase [Piscibacillus halophilus]SER17738.1 Protein N-acetyltransferase, RimJ/RimL family [Piscibacillus halophilus]
MNRVILRDIQEGDLPIFFEHQQDPISNYMAAFTSKNPSDWSQFCNHWNKILTEKTILKQSIIQENKVVGHVISFDMFGEREVTYWINRESWGKGVATEALKQFLRLDPMRPLYARAAKDNIGSRRVLEKCGFFIVDEDKGFANARNMEVEEFVFILKY